MAMHRPHRENPSDTLRGHEERLLMKDDRLLEMRIFKAVVEAGGFTAAAHALNASQPFVSQTTVSYTHLTLPTIYSV